MIANKLLNLEIYNRILLLGNHLVERQSAVRRSRIRAPDRTNTHGLKITEKNVLPL